jgi:alpha-L-rhamnosidase
VFVTDDIGIQTSQVWALPATVTNPRDGLFVADFEQNFAGTCTIRIRNCARGQHVVMRHAEFLNATDGKMIQTDNLRSAQATDTYICRGGVDVEIYTPRFTYHGFRFVEVMLSPYHFVIYHTHTLHYHIMRS